MDKTVRQTKRSRTRYRVLQDDYLKEVAGKLSKDWWQTILALNIPHCEIKAIEDKFRNDVKEQAFEGLRQWKQKKMQEKVRQKAMIDELISALKEVKREDLVFMVSSNRDLAPKITLNRSMSSSAFVHIALTDKNLNRIASQMSTDLNDIFVNLGLTNVQFKAIEYSHPNDINRQALEGLIKWRDQTDMKTNDSESMFATLVSALTAAKRQDLVDFINRLKEVPESDEVNSDEIITQPKQAVTVSDLSHVEKTSLVLNTGSSDENKQQSIYVKKLRSYFEKKISEKENATNHSYDTKRSMKKGHNVHSEETDVIGGFGSSRVNEDKSTLLRRLGLKDFYPEKMTLAEVVGTHNAAKNVSYSDIPTIFLRNIIMVNYNGRDILIEKVLDQLSKSQSKSEDWNVLDVNNEMEPYTCEQNISLNPLDLVVSVWLCSSPELRQALASKLFMCRLAIPLSLPSEPGRFPTFNLWPLRSIILEKKFKNTYFQSNPLSCPVHVVTFVRLGQICISKSVLMNRLLSDKAHSSFFNKDCNLGSTKRKISEGLIEIAWHLPTENEQHITMYTNLRGDSYHLENEFYALSQISSIVILMMNIKSFKFPETRRRIMALHENGLSVVLAIDAHTETESDAQQICQKYIKKLGTYGSKTRICKVAFNTRIRGFADIKKDIMKEINGVLNNKKGVGISKRITSEKHRLFYTDEENKDFTEAKEKVNVFMKLIQNHPVNVKDNIVPLQGQPWRELSKLLKKKERLFNITATSARKELLDTDEEEDEQFKQYNSIENEMSKLRKDQIEMYRKKGEILRYFFESFCDSCKSDTDRMLFTNYLKMDLDDRSRTVLERFYDVEGNIVDSVLKEYKTTEMKLVETSFCFEHLLRECGQLYEAFNANEDHTEEDKHICDKLSQMAVELLLMGNSIELMDGDVSNVPMQWIKAVLGKLKENIGDNKLLILSVLGIQSSGKSTLLNTMFGLKFAVSAGRCTKGVYMQLVPVKNIKFSYIAVIDTEGLRAMELAHQRYDHDNILATFIIGIADATIINVKGENTTEMKDILQIVVHAFLRLKLVNDKINLKQSCFFVHQNVPGVDAIIKMGPERQKLVEILNDMTKEAAQQENITKIQYFNQVIEFNCDRNVWYCSDLWEGNPPMAPTNPGYSRNASDVKDAIIAELTSSRDTYLTITDTMIRIEDLWFGILRDDFVYGFRNSLEYKAYSAVEKRYTEIGWELADFCYEYLIQKAKTVIGGSTAEEDLGYQVEQLIKKLQKEAEDKLTSCIASYDDFIKESDLKDVMVQWSSTRKTQLRSKKDSLLAETEKSIARLKKEKLEAMRESEEKIKFERDINEKARQLAIQLQGKQADEETMMIEFETIWSDFFQPISSLKDIEDVDFVKKEIENCVYETDDTDDKKDPLKGPVKKAKEDYHYELMTCLPGSMKADEFKIGEHIEVTSPVEFSADHKKYQEHAVDFTNTIFQRIDNELYKIISEDRRFNVKSVIDIIKIIDEITENHKNDNAKETNQSTFNLLSPYNALVKCHVVHYITNVLTRNEKEYIKRHSLRYQLENYKETAVELFRGVLDKEMEYMIAANFFQKVLVEKVTQHVLDLIPLDVHKCMLKKYSQRKCFVMKEVMKDLAIKKDFNNSFQYVMDPFSFVEKWLTENMLSFIFDKQQSGGSRYEQFANRYIKNIFGRTKAKVQMTTQQCKEQSKVSINEWIKRFCTNLSSSKILPVSKEIFVHVTEREKTDIFAFEDTVLKKMNQMENVVRDKFKETTSQNIKWRKSPISGVISALWGCKEKCPFCFEPCKNTLPNHYQDKIQHQCLQHRVQGLSGIHLMDSQKLNLKFCNTLITKRNSFNFNEKKSKFQNYQDRFPEWYIEPTSDKSKYWIWLLCHFKKDFEKRHGKIFEDIPESWKKITEEEALKSLD